MPNGRLFASKNIKDSNFRKLLRGMAGELFRANGLLRDYNCEFLPDKTERFISEWESAVGIPDDCFDGKGDNESRRIAILTKLASLGIQTTNDFIELAATFGVTITIEPLIINGAPPYQPPFIPYGEAGARFTMVVSGIDLVSNVPPYDIPYTLRSGQSILECLFRKIKPANTEIIFRNSN